MQASTCSRLLSFRVDTRKIHPTNTKFILRPTPLLPTAECNFGILLHEYKNMCLTMSLLKLRQIFQKIDYFPEHTNRCFVYRLL